MEAEPVKDKEKAEKLAAARKKVSTKAPQHSTNPIY